MRFHHAVVATLAVCAGSLPAAQAFTKGEMLLPSYLCGPAKANADGTIVGAEAVPKPKALGAVLKDLVEYTFANSKEVNADNDFFYDPVNDPMIFLGAMHNAHAAGMNQQFHGAPTQRLPAAPAANQGNQVTANAPLNAYNNKTIPIAAQTNVLNVLPIAAIPNATADVAGNMLPPANVLAGITPNTLTILSLQAKNDILGGNPANNKFDPANGADNALDGAIVYAQNAKNVRVGKFASGGENAVPWAACGADNNGIVHTQLLSDTNVYNGPTFFLPFWYAWPGGANPGTSTITFMGAAVSDGGFGYHQTPVTVKPLPDLVLNIANLNPNDVTMCMQKNNVACWASCFDCINQAGSKAANPQAKVKAVTAAGAAKLTCTFDANIGNPNKGQLTIWSAACSINNKATPVVPPGTFWVAPLKPQDAAGNDLSADQQATMDAVQQAFATAATGTDPMATNNNNCPTSNTPTNVNTAQTTHINWFTSLALAVTGVFAARR